MARVSARVARGGSGGRDEKQGRTQTDSKVGDDSSGPKKKRAKSPPVDDATDEKEVRTQGK